MSILRVCVGIEDVFEANEQVDLVLMQKSWIRIEEQVNREVDAACMRQAK